MFDFLKRETKWKPEARIDLNECVIKSRWLPDGNQLHALTADGKLNALNSTVKSRALLWKLDLHQPFALDLSLSPDGAWVATGGSDGKVAICSTTKPGVKVLLNTGKGWVNHVAWSNGLERFLITAADKQLNVWSWEGEIICTMEPNDFSFFDLHVHPQLSFFATVSNNKLQFWSTAVPKPAHEEIHESGALIAVAWSPNGKYVACGGQDKAVYYWDVDVGAKYQMPGYLTKVRHLAWDSSSTWLATAGGTESIVWNFSGNGPQGSKPLVLANHLGMLTAVCFHPSAAILASADELGEVFLWDVRRAKTLRSYDCAAPVESLSWSPNGKLAIGDRKGILSIMPVANYQ